MAIEVHPYLKGQVIVSDTDTGDITPQRKQAPKLAQRVQSTLINTTRAVGAIALLGAPNTAHAQPNTNLLVPDGGSTTLFLAGSTNPCEKITVTDNNAANQLQWVRGCDPDLMPAVFDPANNAYLLDDTDPANPWKARDIYLTKEGLQYRMHYDSRNWATQRAIPRDPNLRFTVDTNQLRALTHPQYGRVLFGEDGLGLRVCVHTPNDAWHQETATPDHMNVLRCPRKIPGTGLLPQYELLTDIHYKPNLDGSTTLIYNSDAWKCDDSRGCEGDQRGIGYYDNVIDSKNLLGRRRALGVRL